jgi:hypothetical protein
MQNYGTSYIFANKAISGEIVAKYSTQTTFTHEPPHIGQAWLQRLIHQASRSFV